ncbi:MAG: hypothetical protein NC900_06020 [Candidatus Omnitrophica bacterium]|nr:hypothetical protein [Candidatus Omnitrophota bacterium]
MGIFEPTLGTGLSREILPSTFFLGSLLDDNEVVSGSSFFRERSHLSLDRLINLRIYFLPYKFENFFLNISEGTKPLISLVNLQGKLIFKNEILPFNRLKEKHTSLLLHPYLPYSFTIYFKDRQRAYIEFSFYLSEEGKPIFINRKITSGNLEADLLSLRYVLRCLGLMASQFPKRSWQTVKIELTRSDQD